LRDLFLSEIAAVKAERKRLPTLGPATKAHPAAPNAPPEGTVHHSLSSSVSNSASSASTSTSTAGSSGTGTTSGGGAAPTATATGTRLYGSGTSPTSSSTSSSSLPTATGASTVIAGTTSSSSSSSSGSGKDLDEDRTDASLFSPEPANPEGRHSHVGHHGGAGLSRSDSARLACALLLTYHAIH
jgi:hypothetical protein